MVYSAWHPRPMWAVDEKQGLKCTELEASGWEMVGNLLLNGEKKKNPSNKERIRLMHRKR